MKSKVNTRIKTLRELMRKKQYDYYFISSRTAHSTDFIATSWQNRAWISNFNGSSGEVLIGQDCAFLWTDGCYYMQAKEEINNKIYILNVSDNVENWLSINAMQKAIGIDPETVSIKRGIVIKKIMENSSKIALLA